MCCFFLFNHYDRKLRASFSLYGHELRICFFGTSPEVFLSNYYEP